MKKGLKYILDALRMAHRLDRVMLPVIAVSSVIKAGVPFIGILLSAFVLDALTAEPDFKRIVITAAGGVALTFLLSVLAARLTKYSQARWEACYWKWENLTGEKSLQLDYPQLEDPKITQLRDRMNNDRNWGSGIANTYSLFDDVVGAFSGFVFSAALLIPLLSNPVFYRSRLSASFLAAIAVITAGVVIFDQTFTKKRQLDYMSGSPKSWRPVNYFIYSSFDYKAGKDIRIYNAQPLIRSYIEDPAYKTETKAETAKVSNASGMSGALSGAAQALIMGGAYLFVLLLSGAGSMSVAMVIRSAAGLYQLTQGISGLFVGLSHFAIDTQRLQSKFEYLGIPPVLYKGTLTTEKRADNDYTIEFHDVSFKYPGSDAYALRNFSLKLKVGERLAVVGMNGSGKTTMIKLLCRLYDATEGTITLNGIDIKKYDYDEYISLFGVVFQDFKLFSFSLGQNVAADGKYDAEKAKASLTKAGFSDRLAALEKGLDTALYKDYDENGVEISGGEAQKIALARAIYKNAPFIILDEPTAALDPIAEYEIYTKFNEIVGDRTAVYISHRLSSCRFCGDIAVFHEGRLLQRGSHETLLADTGGKYRELWNAQAQYYTEDAAV